LSQADHQLVTGLCNLGAGIIVAMSDDLLEIRLGVLLRQRGLRLAVAESCTGGLIGHRITNVSGSSTYFVGGVISYANEAKESLLGVRRETLAVHGAVSQETVVEMARGVRKLLSAELGLAVSGIAGPGGGTQDKPVGTVWIGLSAPGREQAWLSQLAGDRSQVKAQAADHALQHLVEYLDGAG
jgi:PncC family amidohydrolase